MDEKNRQVLKKICIIFSEEGAIIERPEYLFEKTTTNINNVIKYLQRIAIGQCSGARGDIFYGLQTAFRLRPHRRQPQAIAELVEGFRKGNQFQTLLGVTGSGKTFTMANVNQTLNKPTLVIAHNKTLAGQLYNEFKGFFPENAVEYFVSYYDYGNTHTRCCVV